MDMNYITEEVLTKLDACEDGKAWWLRNELSGFPVDRLKEIKGDYKEYIIWLKDKFYNCTYDSNNNMLSRTHYNDYIIKYTYDSNNNMLSEVRPNGNVLKMTYDSNNNMLSETYQNGDKITWSYDSNGNMLSEKYPHSDIIKYTYDTNNNKLSEVRHNIITKYTYDSNNNKLSETYSNGAKTTWEYDTDNGVTLKEDGKQILHIPKF